MTKEMHFTPFSINKGGMLPQEEMLEVGNRHKKIVIGIPKESDPHESRVALTPEAVEVLVQNGHEVVIESNAGKEANYTDNHYSECGGYIASRREEVYKCGIVLKVAPLDQEEISLLKGGQLILSSLNLKAQSCGQIRSLMKKKVTAISFEKIRDKNNVPPVVQSMSEIAGQASVLIGAEYLSNAHQGKGVFLGGVTGITPTEVVILGAGTAGKCAARTAIGLGADVKIFDQSLAKLRSIQEYLGRRLYTSVYHPKIMQKTLKSADVVIGAINLVEKGPRYIISEEMVMGMKKGSVIIDVSIDQGGCVETSMCTNHGEPTYEKHGVIHYCVPNIPSRVAKTASIALSNIFSPMLLRIGEIGGVKNLLKEEVGVRKGVYLYNGILTSNYIGNFFGIPSKDIDLLMAAF